MNSSRPSSSAQSSFPTGLDKKELRRLKKIESARQSRIRNRAKEDAIERQVFVNNERIRYLERQVDVLTAELLDDRSPVYVSPRPVYGGDPFWEMSHYYNFYDLLPERSLRDLRTNFCSRIVPSAWTNPLASYLS